MGEPALADEELEHRAQRSDRLEHLPRICERVRRPEKAALAADETDNRAPVGREAPGSANLCQDSCQLRLRNGSTNTPTSPTRPITPRLRVTTTRTTTAVVQTTMIASPTICLRIITLSKACLGSVAVLVWSRSLCLHFKENT